MLAAPVHTLFVDASFGYIPHAPRQCARTTVQADHPESDEEDDAEEEEEKPKSKKKPAKKKKPVQLDQCVAMATKPPNHQTTIPPCPAPSTTTTCLPPPSPSASQHK